MLGCRCQTARQTDLPAPTYEKGFPQDQIDCQQPVSDRHLCSLHSKIEHLSLASEVHKHRCAAIWPTQPAGGTSFVAPADTRWPLASPLPILQPTDTRSLAAYGRTIRPKLWHKHLTQVVLTNDAARDRHQPLLRLKTHGKQRNAETVRLIFQL